MIYVIGSGPAAIAAAHALLERQLPVTMLDVGEELEPERQRLLDELYASPADRWRPEALAKLREGIRADAGGVPEKLAYGSNYPFRDVGQAGRIEARNAEHLISGARGGLSNVWGANFMPYAARDIADWCITPADLAPHYAAVASFVPASFGRDDLEEDFPVYGEGTGQLRPSRQAAQLMAQLNRNREALGREGMRAGFARLAVQAKASAHNSHDCVYCGRCLYGCPYRLIYSSAHTLRELLRNPQFRYAPGHIVERVAETGSAVEIFGRRVEDGASFTLTGDRVYLACGAFATTRILLESMGAYDAAVELRDSHYFLLPMLHSKYTRGVMQEELHTLGQVYLELFDPALSRRTIQLQFYTYNDLYATAIRAKLGLFAGLANGLLPLLLGRLSLIMGYFHSDDSAPISIRLERTGGESRLRLESVETKRPFELSAGVLRKLWRNRNRIGAIPLEMAMRHTTPGKGYHYGGSFPMKKNPGRFETDPLGRPAGFRRVHAVDATVMPSIAATTVVFTAMANAHRIASRPGDI